MRRRYARLSQFFLAVLVSSILAVPTYGQLGKGVITGTVTDPTGAVIPGATVALVNEATGVERTIQTSSAGLYRFEFADVGSYLVRISAKGFADYEVQH